MIARAVIGANFGDEGKGLVTDYLCRQGAGVVVRFNGGAQAGHTVCTFDRKHRHVFSHIGSGAFCGVPTFLSQFFICNPIAFFQELDLLDKMGLNPDVYAHPDCLVTTFADILINRRVEDKRGDKRHGSTGMGISTTIDRSRLDHLKLTMADLWNGRNIEPIVDEICNKFAKFMTGSVIDEPKMADSFIAGCSKFAEYVRPAGIGQCKDPVFEGAQGLLLDQNNRAYFPHLTRSNTGIKNVRTLCDQAGVSEIEAYYVSRTYLTRHGAGPLPGEVEHMAYPDETNVDHAYQGPLRFAPLDDPRDRCRVDFGSDRFKFVLTHCDQLKPPILADLYSYGETAVDVHESGVRNEK